MSDDAVPEAYVPSLADFESLASTMDRQREQTALVDGEVMRGRQIGTHFVPNDRDGLRDAAQTAQEVLRGLKGGD